MSRTTDPPERPDPLEPPARRPAAEDFLPRDVAEALLELLLCDAEIERRRRRLARLDSHLGEALWTPEGAALRKEVRATIEPLLHYLDQARQAAAHAERIVPVEISGKFAAAGREHSTLEALDHRLYRVFFAGIEGTAVSALRHLMSCPVCERMTRILLLGFLSPRAPWLDGSTLWQEPA